MKSVLLFFAVWGAFRAAGNPGDAARAFLEDAGVLQYGEIFYHRRSDNVTECLHNADARGRVIQICTGRTLIERCGGGEVYVLDACAGRQCVGAFASAHSMCLLQGIGIVLQNATEDGSVCSLPPGEHGLFEWRVPPWALAIGDDNNFSCLTALPERTRLQRRVVCEGDRPAIQHRLVFDSDAFLKTDERDVQCAVKQECGTLSGFTGEIACYELPDLDAPDPLLLPQSNPDEGSASRVSVSMALLFVCALLSFLYYT